MVFMIKSDSKIGERVKRIRLQKNLSLRKLEELSGVPYQNLHKLEAGRQKETTCTNAFGIATALGVTIEWLITGQERFGISVIAGNEQKVVTTQYPKVTCYVPVITWKEAGKTIKCAEDVKLSANRKHIPVMGEDANLQTFALCMQGDSMSSSGPRQISFIDGDYLFFSPDKPPFPDCFVIARSKHESTAIFRQLVIDCGTPYLRPINNQYPVIKLTDEYAIFGVLIGCFRDFSTNKNTNEKLFEKAKTLESFEKA
jgi:SOS-response transcriptional repressor LexA